MRGADLFRFTCRSCHGAGGRGMAPEILPLVNLVKATSADWQKEQGAGAADRAKLAEKLLQHQITAGGRSMPGFNFLASEESEALLGYLEHLASIAGSEARRPHAPDSGRPGRRADRQGHLSDLPRGLAGDRQAPDRVDDSAALRHDRLAFGQGSSSPAPGIAARPASRARGPRSPTCATTSSKRPTSTSLPTRRAEAVLSHRLPPHHVDVDVEVRYFETDQMGVVHHANYIVWCELARTRLCLEAGFHYAEIEKRGLLLLVTGVHLSYRSPARYGDTVRAACWVDRVSSRGVTFEYRIERGDPAGTLLEPRSSPPLRPSTSGSTPGRAGRCASPRSSRRRSSAFCRTAAAAATVD